MKLNFCVRDRALVPWDEEAEAWLSRRRYDDHITVEAKRIRNPKFHRKFFGMLNKVVYPNQEKFDSLDWMLTDLKIRVGHCDTMIMEDGRVVYIPKSISFEKMDQDKFERFYNLCVDVIINHYLPAGWDEQQIADAVLELVG